MTTTLADVLRYRTIDTPVGTLLLISSDKGLVRVAFATAGHDRVLVDHTSAAGVPRPDTDGAGTHGPGIVRSHGAPGGHLGGAPTKRVLLDLEAA